MEGDAEVLGEAEWLNRVVRDFERPLSRYALSITRNQEQALDAVQETFLLLMKHLAKVDRARPAPWLFTVCRSKAIDLLRRDGKMEARSYEELAQLSRLTLSETGFSRLLTLTPHPASRSERSRVSRS